MKLKNIVATLCLLTLSSTASAGLINAGFEDGNLTSWNTTGDVVVTQSISDFQTDSYGGIGSINTFEGMYMAQLSAGTIGANSLASIMGVTETALEATNNGANATDGSLMYQSTTANAGDSFTFNWNFVEEDYLPYDDWAFYGVQFENQATQLFKFASLGVTGPSSGASINGWESLTVNIAQTGAYKFYFGVVNTGDTALDSTLFIDGISGTGTLSTDVPEPSSIAILSLGLLALIRFRKRS